MSDNLITPATGAVLATKEIGGVHFPQNLLADLAGADVLGAVAATPAANSVLGRLKAIADAVTAQSAYVDGLEALATTLNGYVDGLEALTGTTNSTLTAISGFVDGLETLIGTSNTSLAALAGYVDGLEALAGAATPAGENWIGKTGGDVLIVPGNAPVISTSAYATGNVIGSKLTFANAVRVAAGAGFIQSASLYSKSVQTAAIDLLIFSADPAASTFTDKAALAINPADRDKLRGVIHLTDWSALGTESIGQNLSAALSFKLATGTSLYGVMVSRAAFTPLSTSDLTPSLNVIPG
jgi:hypothetical protein